LIAPPTTPLHSQPETSRDNYLDSYRCWSHCRTKVWEAAITIKDVVAREGLARIRRIFELDRAWRHRPPAEIKALRDEHLRPHVDPFINWVDVEYDKVKFQRRFLRTALGYAHRQQGTRRS